MEAAPTYLKARVETGHALPVVEQTSQQARGRGRVLRYVLCEMKAELFVELMETVGRVGCVVQRRT